MSKSDAGESQSKKPAEKTAEKAGWMNPTI